VRASRKRSGATHAAGGSSGGRPRPPPTAATASRGARRWGDGVLTSARPMTGRGLGVAGAARRPSARPTPARAPTRGGERGAPPPSTRARAQRGAPPRSPVMTQFGLRGWGGVLWRGVLWRGVHARCCGPGGGGAGGVDPHRSRGTRAISCQVPHQASITDTWRWPHCFGLAADFLRMRSLAAVSYGGCLARYA